ncbi:MAG: Spore germination protein YaaH [Firmicutes bacterium ADurb.Bin193]|nr:MAG: Spore germination protein YaaH [Firmicutes bacterium ADurb.Bin193]
MKGAVILIIHVVRPGDTIFRLSQAYNVPYQELISSNGLENANQLAVGQAIVIPADSIPHTVTRGQTLYSIARAYRVALNDVVAANPQITNPSQIFVGQVINIPVSTQKLGTIEVNGYAFPNIAGGILQGTLPHLTYLSIFSYQVRPDGSLSTINDTPLIAAARQARVAPMMVITNIEEGASFSSDLAHTILTSNAVQETLIANVIRILDDKNYYGLDIDFEYIFPEDRENYNNFLRKVTSRLRPLGYVITTALAPKTSAGQVGLLYQAHDYPVHGALADHVILMTYEWGYTYGPPMAVSPLNQVRRVLNYAVTAIPSQKILMGMPNYGYDWTLPFVRGSAARTISNVDAAALAARIGSEIQFDEAAQSPFFYYSAEGRRHVVWFEDARSVRASLRLVAEYNLGGVSYWTINRFFPQNWLVLESMYNVRKLL